MLKSFFFSQNFHRFCQSGCYLDFFFKKISEFVIKYVYIYGAQFFGEKYVIEELTRKIFEKSFWKLNKYVGLTKLFYSLFFVQLISCIFYLLMLFCFIV